MMSVYGYPANVDYMVNTASWAGAQELVYNTASCRFVSQSAYPYQFKVIDYPNTWGFSKYGPNRFRNEKVRHMSQSVEARFDDKARSTFVPASQISPDSNQIGFFVDPQDFKNKDIVRHFGDYDFMDAIGDPGNQFSASYTSLRAFRKEYADGYNELSGSKTLFNELMILYKLYFNRSVFDAIKNVVPARTNVLVGVLIEPTILERPKYQSKEIFTEMNTGSVLYFDVTASHYFRDYNTKLVRLTESIDFGLSASMDLSYINLPNRIYPVNYGGDSIADTPDLYERGHYVESSLFDMLRNEHRVTGSSQFLLKRWKKYVVYSKSGSFNRTVNPNDNTYATSSVYLYDYILASEAWYSQLVYTSSIVDGTSADNSFYIGPSDTWQHMAGTFRNSPNAFTNNYVLTFDISRSHAPDPINWPTGEGHPVYDLPPIYVDDGTYFEVVMGYPRNHFTHKRDLFSLYNLMTFGMTDRTVTRGTYLRNLQTANSTVGTNGLEDGTDPVQSTPVGDVNLIQTDNVINH